MSIVLRFSRHGKRHAPVHRIVAIDKRKACNGLPKEYLGTVNPQGKEKVVSLNIERIEYWRSQGAEVSVALQKILSKQGIMSAPVYQVQTKKCLPKKKAQERAAA